MKSIIAKIKGVFKGRKPKKVTMIIPSRKRNN
jgi:hypothetical protein